MYIDIMYIYMMYIIYIIYMHAFFISNISVSSARLKLAKNSAKAKQHPEVDFHYLKIIHFFHSRYHLKIIGDILKKYTENNRVCFYDVI